MSPKPCVYRWGHLVVEKLKISAVILGLVVSAYLGQLAFRESILIGFVFLLVGWEFVGAACAVILVGLIALPVHLLEVLFKRNFCRTRENRGKKVEASKEDLDKIA